MINVAPRLEADIFVLEEMFKGEESDSVCVRSRKVLQVMYGFADASGRGFGSTFQTPEETAYRIGLWSRDEGDENT